MKQLYLFILLFSPLLGLTQSQNFWTKKSDFGGLKRERAVAFAIGDYGYVGTGVDTNEVVLKDFWKYDATTDTWTQVADLPGSARRDAVGFSIGSKGYVGTGIDNDESFSGIKLKDFWEYDATTNIWTQKADYPGAGGAGIYFSTGFCVDSKGYICCGKVGPNFYNNQLWEYKPSINQWTQRANFPGGVRYQLSSFAIGYNGYVGLGANQDVFKKDFWKYSPGTNSWTAIADFPASERGGACSFTIKERGFVCLGSDGGVLDDLWEYNPNTDQWSVRATYGGSSRKNAFAFVVNNKAYVGTGKGDSGKKESMYEYTPMDVLGIEENNLSSFSIFPNPASQKFKIKTENNSIEKLRICTFDGRIINDIEMSNGNEMEINCEHMNAGCYLLVALNAADQTLSIKQLILF